MTRSTETMVEITDVWKSFGPLEVLRGVDLTVATGEVTTLLGPSGSGKSTLLKLLCSDVMPTDGLIRRHSHVKIGRYHQVCRRHYFMIFRRPEKPPKNQNKSSDTRFMLYITVAWHLISPWG